VQRPGQNHGNRLSIRKRDGQVIGLQYDALSRLTFKDLPGTTSGDVYTTYDLAGRPTAVHFGAAFPSGTGIDYRYDTAERLSSETSFGRTMGFNYDAAFNRTQVTWPDTSNFINYDYDRMNWTSHKFWAPRLGT